MCAVSVNGLPRNQARPPQHASWGVGDPWLRSGGSDRDRPAPTPLRSPRPSRPASGVHKYDHGFFGLDRQGLVSAFPRCDGVALAQLDASADDEGEFDDAVFQEQGELWLELELGVTGASAALCAAGCPTFASCRGHGAEFGGRSRHPWRLFAGDERRFPLLEAAARVAGCRLELDERGLLVAWAAPSLAEIVAFGRALHARRREFADLAGAVPACRRRRRRRLGLVTSPSAGARAPVIR